MLVTSESNSVTELEDIQPGWIVQVVKVGEEMLDTGSVVNEQDYQWQTPANGLLVLTKIDNYSDPFGDDVVVSLADVKQIHVY